MSDLSLRPASLADAPRLERSDSAAVHVLAAASDDPASAYFVAESGGAPIGAMRVVDPALQRTRCWGADCPANHCAFAEPAAEAISIDPLATNTRAHRFYERLGFSFVERRTFGGDDCFVFRLNRAERRPGAPNA